ncbi:flavin reductase family protein [Butyrivibrio sp. INlla16]|uniref:flavin reductase family protein n=1 Tax=Butyrivibrio sp. INlla16 TaxID=1520807 RepID=UPI0008871448|nr:flavin reductase family protein [Butyrivibrio sp. INlla16]SDB45196.1 NADH-FMN oxidoreductase RutF, flavin reductase (DIM6/NTAB) family [Butyrivibrio sp. INlla16]
MAKVVWQPGNMLYPIPAVMVSCGREGEVPNIITAAWVGNVCSSPAMLSISVRKERYSYDIIKETGEFVVNLTNKELLKATDWCGVRSGRDYDKFKEMKLTPQKSNKISAPGIAESPVNIECKVKQILELGSHDMFVAEVMCVDVDDKYMDDKGRFDLGKADLITYSHGEYFDLGKKLGKFGYSVAKKPSNKKTSGKKPSQKKSKKKKQ